MLKRKKSILFYFSENNEQSDQYLKLIKLISLFKDIYEKLKDMHQIIFIAQEIILAEL